MFYQCQPKCRHAPATMFQEDVVVRAPMHSVPQPNHALVSLPLVEVNRGKTRCNTVGKGIRYDRTSVRCPLYGPLSAMAVVDEERMPFSKYPVEVLVHSFSA
mgnify:CR=1 FL=1